MDEEGGRDREGKRERGKRRKGGGGGKDGGIEGEREGGATNMLLDLLVCLVVVSGERRSSTHVCGYTS